MSINECLHFLMTVFGGLSVLLLMLVLINASVVATTAGVMLLLPHDTHHNAHDATIVI